jgi:site-specific DNA recombinase
MSCRAAAYVRVSTQKQVERDLSMSDQLDRIKAHCEQRGYTLCGVFEERGRSAKDDRRPVFQQMIREAMSPEHPFDLILVYNFSRFFRDEIGQELYIRDLAKVGVRLESTTEDSDDTLSGELVRRVLAITAEFDNRRKAETVSHNMIANARRGFWNGSTPPYGYKAVEVAQGGDRTKKVLAVEETEAEIVRQIFGLYLAGDQTCPGPMGIAAIASFLNQKGLRNRRGGKFSKGFVAGALRRTTYIGEHYYNTKDSRTGKARPKADWVEVPGVPAIVDEEQFRRAQGELDRRNPKVTPPRVTNSPTLLTGLLKHSECGGGMTLGTGKGGQYRYYKCAERARKGSTACSGLNLRMEIVDDLVLKHLEDRLFAPERLQDAIGPLLTRAKEKQLMRRDEIGQVKRRLREKEDEIARLYKEVGTGGLELDDTLRGHLSGLKAEREDMIRLIAMAERRADMPIDRISDKKVAAFSRAICQRLRDEDPAFRKAVLRHFVDEVKIDENEIRITGAKSVLLAGIADGQKGRVPSFDRSWWARQDSNLQLRRYERRVLTN